MNPYITLSDVHTFLLYCTYLSYTFFALTHQNINNNHEGNANKLDPNTHTYCSLTKYLIFLLNSCSYDVQPFLNYKKKFFSQLKKDKQSMNKSNFSVESVLTSYKD